MGKIPRPFYPKFRGIVEHYPDWSASMIAVYDVLCYEARESEAAGVMGGIVRPSIRQMSKGVNQGKGLSTFIWAMKQLEKWNYIEKTPGGYRIVNWTGDEPGMTGRQDGEKQRRKGQRAAPPPPTRAINETRVDRAKRVINGPSVDRGIGVINGPSVDRNLLIATPPPIDHPIIISKKERGGAPGRVASRPTFRRRFTKLDTSEATRSVSTRRRRKRGERGDPDRPRGDPGNRPEPAVRDRAPATDGPPVKTDAPRGTSRVNSGITVRPRPRIPDPPQAELFEIPDPPMHVWIDRPRACIGYSEEFQVGLHDHFCERRRFQLGWLKAALDRAGHELYDRLSVKPPRMKSDQASMLEWVRSRVTTLLHNRKEFEETKERERLRRNHQEDLGIAELKEKITIRATGSSVAERAWKRAAEAPEEETIEIGDLSDREEDSNPSRRKLLGDVRRLPPKV